MIEFSTTLVGGCGPCCPCYVDVCFDLATYVQDKLGFRFGSSGPVYREATYSGSITFECDGPPSPQISTYNAAGTLFSARITGAVTGAFSTTMGTFSGGIPACGATVPAGATPFCVDCNVDVDVRTLSASGGPCGCGENTGRSSGSHICFLSNEYTMAQVIEDAKATVEFDPGMECSVQDEEAPHLVGSALFYQTGSFEYCEATKSRMRLRFQLPANGEGCVRVSYMLKTCNLDGSGVTDVTGIREELSFTLDFSGYDAGDPETWPEEFVDIPWPAATDKIVFPAEFVFECPGCET